MIKAVIFDYGGVVTSGGGGNELAERLSSNLNISVPRANELLNGPWHEFIAGKISDGQFWRKLEVTHGSPIPKKFREIWNGWDVMQPRPEMLNFINSLKALGMTVGLLSNVVPMTEAVLRQHGIYALFSPCILSCRDHMVKPDIEIYQLLLKQLDDIPPWQVIYIDDQVKCLVPASDLGMHTVHATSAKQIIKDVNAIIRSERS